MEYNHFTSKTKRMEVVKIGNILAQYLFDNEINNIIFADRSARPGYIALKKAWKNKFPNKPIPNIYFTNPEGYNTNNRNLEEIMNEFNKVYKKLSSNKTTKIMIFDVCMHTGDTLSSIFKALNKYGYNNVVAGLTQPKDSGYSCNVTIDFSALVYEPKGVCYPFMRDNMIEKNRNSILSSKNNNTGDKKESLQLRKEISSLF